MHIQVGEGLDTPGRAFEHAPLGFPEEKETIVAYSVDGPSLLASVALLFHMGSDVTQKDAASGYQNEEARVRG